MSKSVKRYKVESTAETIAGEPRMIYKIFYAPFLDINSEGPALWKEIGYTRTERDAEILIELHKCTGVKYYE